MKQIADEVQFYDTKWFYLCVHSILEMKKMKKKKNNEITRGYID